MKKGARILVLVLFVGLPFPLLCGGQTSGLAGQERGPSDGSNAWTKAAHAYHCSESEAAERSKRIRPEMRSAFMEGRLLDQSSNSNVCQNAVRPENISSFQAAPNTNWFPWIACGSPAITEIVFALGCSDRVIGVSADSKYPAEAVTRNNIGGWANPNRECLLSFKPNIIVAQQGKHDALAAIAKEYGVRFHSVKLDTLDDIYAAIQSIADVLSVPARGKSLVAGIQKDIQSVRQRVADRPQKRVLLLSGQSSGALTNLTAIGSGTFPGEIVGLAGGTNVFWDAESAYSKVSKESLLACNPDVILEINPNGLPEETGGRLRADEQALRGIPAVESGHIYCLTNDFVLIPGPRIGQTALKMSEAIHPEVRHE